MDSFLIIEETEIKRQEGDTGSISITVPDEIDLSLFTEIAFTVENGGSVQITKLLSNNSLTVDGQVINIPLLIADTTLKAGNHRWKLRGTALPTLATSMGKGNFTIVKLI